MKHGNILYNDIADSANIYQVYILLSATLGELILEHERYERSSVQFNCRRVQFCITGHAHAVFDFDSVSRLRYIRTKRVSSIRVLVRTRSSGC